MPTTEQSRRYNNGKIYTIRSYLTDEIYIGSTCTLLSKRLSGHKKHYKEYKDGKFAFVTSFKIIEKGDAYIELLESFPCNSKEELHAKEGYYIRSMACINKVVPGRTKKEWRDNNKETISVKDKQYREVNKEKISIKKKQYREANKEELTIKNKAYHDANKDKAEKLAKQPIYCEYCDKNVRKDSVLRHTKSTKHTKNFILY